MRGGTFDPPTQGDTNIYISRSLRAPIPNKRNVNVILQCWISDLGGGACAQSGNLPPTPSPFIFHSVFLTVTHGFRASYIQPTWKAWMGPPLQQSVTQPVIARYVRLSASPCRLSRAHASGERVHAAGGQRVHAGCRSCVGKRCIVSALTRCVANINQDNRRILRLSSLPLAKNALHSPTSIWMEGLCVVGWWGGSGFFLVFLFIFYS